MTQINLKKMYYIDYDLNIKVGYGFILEYMDLYMKESAFIQFEGDKVFYKVDVDDIAYSKSEAKEKIKNRANKSIAYSKEEIVRYQNRLAKLEKILEL